LLLLLLLLSACGGGGAPDPGGGAVRYTLSGQVLDAGGKALPGVQLLLSLNAAVSDAEGRFSFGNLPAGSYVLSLQDASGNFDSRRLSVGQGSTNFQFSLPAGQPELHVVSTSPRLNSSGAALDGVIELELSEVLNPATLSAADFLINPPLGDLQLELRGTKLSISPRLQLPVGQSVLLEYVGSISSAGGSSMTQPLRLRFHTAASDTYAPRLVQTRPAASATKHPPNLSVSFEFNENLAADTGSLNLTILPETDYSLRVSGNTLLVSPLGGWAVNTDYDIQLAGLRDAAGNLSSQSFGLSFRTGEQAANARSIEPDWNLTTDTIVFASNLNGSYDIFSMRPDGTELTQLTALPGNERNPSLNSDARLLTWQQADSAGFQQIMLLSLNDPQAQPVQLTSAGYNNTDPYFSRSFNNDIIFVSTRQSITGLWSVSADNLLESELDSAFGSNQSDPAFHPLIDGQILFASGRSGNEDIWRKTISIISGEAININLTEQLLSNEHSPAWSPNAAYFVFISDFDGHRNLWNGDLTGGFHTQLTYLNTDLADPIIDPVSGNNRCLVTMDNGNGGSELVLIDLNSGEILANLTGV
jgi:Tol biopolymer transport system component